MKIIAIGDLHGNWGALNKLISKKQPDIILQCGDFGWWPQFEVNRPVLYGHQKRWLLKGIKPGNTKIFWCDGNHEQYSDLQQYQDGQIHELYENVFYCSRSSHMELPDGRRVLFAGGASSVDKDLRTPGLDWFPEENITSEQLYRILETPKADIVVSHTCPSAFEPKIEDITGHKTNDSNRIALNHVLLKHRPDLWVFGHWHRELTDKITCGEGASKFETTFYGLDYPGHGGRWWRET